MNKAANESRTLLFVVAILVAGAVLSQFMSRPDQPAAQPPAPAPAPTSAPAVQPAPVPALQPNPPVTAGDMKREKMGRYGSHAVSALDKDGQLLVTFTPALPRNERSVLGGAEYALRHFKGVATTNAKWRPVSAFLRVTVRSGSFDVLLIKNDDGTVHSMSITKLP